MPRLEPAACSCRRSTRSPTITRSSKARACSSCRSTLRSGSILLPWFGGSVAGSHRYGKRAAPRRAQASLYLSPKGSIDPLACKEVSMSTVSVERVEHVLVVPTAAFHQLGHFQGFSTDTQKYLAGLLVPEHTSYRARDKMEQDPSFKQLIPYVIFRHRDPAG